jgi:enoyl-CoA hydratase/carnithine racemase
VTLNRPERMNSMAFDVMVPLKEVLGELSYDNSVRAVVLTGAGRGFSSGADHKSAGSVPHVAGLTRPSFGLRSMELLDDVILAMRRLHQPIIAAVNGAAIGGGLCLALAADMLPACFEIAARIAAFSRPGTELTKRTLWSGLDAGSLEGHMQAEGLGQLYVRLLTANFEEAVAARAENRAPVFTDDKT